MPPCRANPRFKLDSADALSIHFFPFPPPGHHTDFPPSHDDFSPAPRAPLGVPVWKPFLNRRGTSFSDRMRPVPVVFLRFAFSPQLSDDVSWLQGRVRRRTLPDLGCGIAARRAGVLLNVEGAAAWSRSADVRSCCHGLCLRRPTTTTAEGVGFVLRRSETDSQRALRHLTWRLPKLEVPFAVDRQ